MTTVTGGAPAAPSSSTSSESSAPAAQPKQSAPARGHRVGAPLKDSSENDTQPKETPKETKPAEPKVEKKEAAPEKKEPSEKPESKEAAEAAKEEKKEAERRKYKLKVNGQEREREFTDEEIQRRLQTWEAAEEKFSKASEVEKQMKNFVQALRENPLEVLSQLGLDEQLDSLAEQRLTSKVKKELMSPEERELEELREFKRSQEERLREQEKQTQTAAEKEAYEKHYQQSVKHYDEKITEVLDASDLPKTAHSVKRIASLLYSALEKGYELDIATAVDMVRDEYMTDIQTMFGDVPVEKILKVLGPDLAKKIRKYDLDQLKARKVPAAPSSPADQIPDLMEKQMSAPRSSRGEKKLMNQHEWIENARKKAGVE